MASMAPASTTDNLPARLLIRGIAPQLPDRDGQMIAPTGREGTASGETGL
jgi:hypothetical protein